MRVGDRLTIDLTLTVGNLTEEVVVAGGTPLLETTNAAREVSLGIRCTI